jgi:hypothetical protein
VYCILYISLNIHKIIIMLKGKSHEKVGELRAWAVSLALVKNRCGFFYHRNHRNERADQQIQKRVAVRSWSLD